MFSRGLLGTSTKKTKMNWWEYWIGHCWMTGWQSINHSFRNWADLMTGNWKDYAILSSDSPFEECYECFWSYLGEDDTYPKEFLEGLMDMVDRIDRGEEEVVMISLDELKKMSDLLNEVEDNAGN